MIQAYPNTTINPLYNTPPSVCNDLAYLIKQKTHDNAKQHIHQLVTCVFLGTFDLSAKTGE